MKFLTVTILIITSLSFSLYAQEEITTEKNQSVQTEAEVAEAEVAEAEVAEAEVAEAEVAEAEVAEAEVAEVAEAEVAEAEVAEAEVAEAEVAEAEVTEAEVTETEVTETEVTETEVTETEVTETEVTEAEVDETEVDEVTEAETANAEITEDKTEPTTKTDEPTRLDGIAAVVGDEAILLSELESYTLLRLNNEQINPMSVDLEKIRQQFLNDLIDNKVLLVQAKSDSVYAVSDEEVERALNNHISTLLRQNNLTMEGLEKEIKRQQGISLVQFRRQMRSAIHEQLLMQRLQQSIYFGTNITRRYVENFYEEYKDKLPTVGESVNLSKLSIRMSASQSRTENAFRKINEIKNRLNAGEDFAELAKEYSEGPEASNGGELGFIARGTINERAFEDKAFSLSPGQISEPFKTRLGFHIIEVIERRERGVRVRQIFLDLTPGEEEIESVKAKLTSIKENITTAEDFKEAAEKHSFDRVSRSRGGEIGWETISDLPSSVRRAVNSLGKGDISEPVQENNIISIYRVNDRVENRSLTLDDDYPFISEKARELKTQETLQELVEKWREETFIDIRI
ncbi:peptidylprolyl isomerase [Chitinispirillales bacterium ANBcel5]|uniref:peptidylprolyl isomerase n=1 Tax=Cellulosispirillum alkaliphilum TaxID=3039283 RepID=UPI002A581177|nr:peptidylprolyl isomerase [Chitinispirillales bacterium ANBcel5]